MLTKQCARLQSDAPRVNVLDQLAKHVWLKLFNYQRLMLIALRKIKFYALVLNKA
jgi:hypothetical protein